MVPGLVPVVVAALIAALAPAAAAQHSRDEKAAAPLPPLPDPYTKHDDEAIERAGYVALGPRPLTFGDDHDTRAIDELLAPTRILWAETAHFKVGTALNAYPLGRDERERKKLQEEFERLAQKLPNLKPKSVRQLDPWLRLHLTAQRLEDLYQDFLQRIGKADSDFPTGSGQTPGGRYFGEGPYLGQPGKFLVLVLTKKSDLGRYFGRYLKTSTDTPRSANFSGCGSLLFATALESAGASLQSDSALHGHLAFSVAKNLVDGYQFFAFLPPIWWKEGLAHWYGRRVDPRFDNFTGLSGLPNPNREWDWAPKVRGRVKFGHFIEADKVMRLQDYTQLTFADHMALWSRVDFLMSQGDARVALFMERLKARPEATAVLSAEDVQRQQEAALREAYGYDAAAFDEAWTRWVLETYPAK